MRFLSFLMHINLLSFLVHSVVVKVTFSHEGDLALLSKSQGNAGSLFLSSSSNMQHKDDFLVFPTPRRSYNMRMYDMKIK
jgi:hypothetical protein